MTTNKPEILAYRVGLAGEPDLGHWFGEENAHPEGYKAEPLIRLSDYEALQAECEKLRLLLSQSAPIVHAHAGASHMLDGFKPKRNKWDSLVEQIDAAMEERNP